MTKENAKEDPTAWRAEYLAKQAAGVKFKINNFGKWVPPSNYFDFSGKKEDYLEVQEDLIEVEFDCAKVARSLSPSKPTIHHIAERKLWLAQREAGTNEVWQGRTPVGSGVYYDLPISYEPQWAPYTEYRVKPKTVKYYMALVRYKTNSPLSMSAKTTGDEFKRSLTHTGWTIIGNIEEREVEV